MGQIVDFILDGELYAQRRWKTIPRVGETILLKNGEIFAEVRHVVWGDETPELKRQWIQILCKTITPTDLSNAKVSDE